MDALHANSIFIMLKRFKLHLGNRFEHIVCCSKYYVINDDREILLFILRILHLCNLLCTCENQVFQWTCECVQFFTFLSLLMSQRDHLKLPFSSFSF